MVISSLKNNDLCVIEKVDYNNDIILNRLADLGVVNGKMVTVVRACEKNSCALLLIDGRLIAVSKEVANCIFVSIIKGENE